MATTAHHKFPVPDPSDEVRKVRVHMKALADDIDAKVKKITYGQAGTAYPASPRDGDIHLTYVDPTPVAPAPPPVVADEPVGPGEPYLTEPATLAAPKRTRKATG
jgi:hypothetical protein